MKLNVCLYGSLLALTLIVSGAWAAPHDITWTDSVSVNPVITQPGVTSANRAYYGDAIFDPHANIFRAWFDASSGMDLAYGESTDNTGTQFRNYAVCTGWDPNLVENLNPGRHSKGHVVQLGPNSFRIYYMVGERTNGGYAIATAVSTDGVHWTSDQLVEGIGTAGAEPRGTWGPIERIAVAMISNGNFVAYCRCQEPEAQTPTGDYVWDQPGDFRVHRYVSTDGVNWQWTNDTGATFESYEDAGGNLVTLSNVEFQSVVKHPDRQGEWYAFASNQNSVDTMMSFHSTDDGATFKLDEPVMNGIGQLASQSYNQQRNFNPSAIYMGNGNWVCFRTVSEPHSTAIATGVESGLEVNVGDWTLY